MKKLLLLLFILLLPVVDAQELNLNYNIEYNKVLTSYKFTNTPQLNLKLPSDYSALSYYIDQKQATPNIINNILTIPSAKEIELNFLTKNPLEYSGSNTLFLTDINLKNIQANIKLTLPENAILSKPIDQGSVFPSNAEITTDGQKITLTWNTHLQDESFSIFIIFKEKKTYWQAIILLIIIIAILAYLLRKKPKIKIKKIVKKRPVKLKPIEKRIVNILHKKGGESEQATLRLVTELPRASLSRILKELEQRNIIKKISRGKKNIIALK